MAVRRPAVQDDGVSSRGCCVHAGLAGHGLEAVSGRISPDVDFGRIGARGEQHALAGRAQHGADVQSGRSADAADTDGAHVAAYLREHGNSRGSVQRGSRGYFRPGFVSVLGQRLGITGERVDPQDPYRPLITALHADHRADAVPAGSDEVLEGGVPPACRGLAERDLSRKSHLGVLAADPDHLQGRLRVGSARLRIAHRSRRSARIRRIGEIPASDHRGVDPGDEQCIAAGRPPVAALPAEGGMVSQPVGHVRVLRLGQRPVLGSVGLYDAQGAPGDVRDQRSVR